MPTVTKRGQTQDTLKCRSWNAFEMIEVTPGTGAELGEHQGRAQGRLLVMITWLSQIVIVGN